MRNAKMLATGRIGTGGPGSQDGQYRTSAVTFEFGDYLMYRRSLHKIQDMPDNWAHIARKQTIKLG